MPLTKIQSLGITDGTIVNADINASAAIAGTKISGSFGKVLQVVSATDSTNRQTTSTSFVTASNTLSVNITPSSTSNKIFVMVSIGYVYIPSGQNIRITLYRNNTTNLGSTDGFAWFNGIGGESSQNFSVYDSPSTTSSTNYQVYIKASGGTGEIGSGLIKSTITAFEIAA